MYHYGGNNPIRYIDPDGRNDDFTPDEKKFIIESQNKATSNLNLLISRIQKYNNNDKELEQSVFDYLGLDINKEKDKQYLLNSLTLIRDDLKNMTINDYAKIMNVTVSGKNGKILPTENGFASEASPAEILMHELAGHAEPRIMGKIGNAIEIENLIRGELLFRSNGTSSKMRMPDLNHGTHKYLY